MRNFKKFLALVLAMLMVSACAVSVSAYNDQAAIDATDFATPDDLTKKPPYIPIMKESVLEGTDEYSGASILLTNAQGITVVEDGQSYAIYVADTDNSRIIGLDTDMKMIIR